MTEFDLQVRFAYLHAFLLLCHPWVIAESYTCVDKGYILGMNC